MRIELTKPIKILILLAILSFVFAVVTISGNPASKVTKTTPTQPVVDNQNEAVSLVKNYQVTRTEPFPESLGVSSQTSLKVIFNKSVQDLKAEIKLEPYLPLEVAVTNEGTMVVATAKAAFNTKTTYTASVYLKGNKFYQWRFTVR